VPTKRGFALPDIVDPAIVAATRRALPAHEVVSDAVEVFRLLASPVRLRIMHALAHHEMSVGDLARAMDLSLSRTSHQLALLRRMKLVACRDEGRLAFYRATDDFVGHLVHDCLAHVEEKLAVGSQPHHHRHRRFPARPRNVPRPP
jgi:ArsR family transcriptional regulator, lead/cadmium/zinc/bismuth-responsive transcriptional repressor